MALRIKRSGDAPTNHCIEHKIADIPGGVTISTKNLGGGVIYEGTPFGNAEGGIKQIVKTARILAKVTDKEVKIEVEKGHHFVVGDYVSGLGATAKAITSIDKSSEAKDVITLEATLGKELAIGTAIIESSSESNEPKVKAVGVIGSTNYIDQGSNFFTSGWLICTVNEARAPIVTDAIKASMKGVIYR